MIERLQKRLVQGCHIQYAITFCLCFKTSPCANFHMKMSLICMEIKLTYRNNPDPNPKVSYIDRGKRQTRKWSTFGL